MKGLATTKVASLKSFEELERPKPMRPRWIAGFAFALAFCLPAAPLAGQSSGSGGLAFEKTQFPKITQDQEWEWLTYLLYGLHVRYSKEYQAERDGSYFVTVALEFCMHSESAVRAAADMFFAGSRDSVDERYRLRTLQLIEQLLFTLSDSSYGFGVADGKLRFYGTFRPIFGGTGAALNPLRPSEFEQLKKEVGLRKLEQFKSQRLSDSDRANFWRVFRQRKTGKH